MDVLIDAFGWLADGANWRGPDGIPTAAARARRSSPWPRMVIACADRDPAGALAGPHRPGRDAGHQRRPTSGGRCRPSRSSSCSSCTAARPATVVVQRHRARPVRDPADPHQHLRRHARGRSRHCGRRPWNGYGRHAAAPQGRAAAGLAAADERRPPRGRAGRRHGDHSRARRRPVASAGSSPAGSAARTIRRCVGGRDARRALALVVEGLMESLQRRLRSGAAGRVDDGSRQWATGRDRQP